MKKMNFSRQTYLKAFMENLIEAKRKGTKTHPFLKEKATAEINFQIDQILEKQTDGFWPVTDGDDVFIRRLNALKELLAGGCREWDLREFSGENQQYAREKVRTVFFTQESFCWPSLASLYQAMTADERYEPKLVYIPFEHANADRAVGHFKIYKEELGLPILRYNEYNLSEDSPDIAFFVKPYTNIPMQYYIADVDKIVRRCVYIPYAFFDIPTDTAKRYGYSLPLHQMAWQFIAYSQHHFDYIKRYGMRDGHNAVILGHPRFDISSGLNGYPKDKITKQYSAKIKNRRTILWNTHHFISDGPESIGAFLQYKDKVFNYFERHQDAFLLWRPHPLLFGALINNNTMSQTELGVLLKSLSEQDNIIVDRSKDYINSFALSDGMLSDGGPSMTFEYVATGKPIYYTVKQNGYKMPEDSIAECWYWVNSPDEVDRYLDMFFAGKDPMKHERAERAKKHIGVVDGHCGERIRDYLVDEIIREEKEKAAYIYC